MKRNFQVEIVSSKEVAQHLRGTDFSHPPSLTRLDTPNQFFPVAIEPHETYLPSMRSDTFENIPSKPVVLPFAVDKGENCIDSILRRLFYHLLSIFANETPEGLCSKLENRLDKLDRDMIVEKLEPCQLC